MFYRSREYHARNMIEKRSGAQVPKATLSALPLSYARTVERAAGLEPATSRLEADCMPQLLGCA